MTLLRHPLAREQARHFLNLKKMKRGASQTTAPRKRQTLWPGSGAGAVPVAVRVYLRDAVARDAVNTLYTLGGVDAVDVVRSAGRNPFQPLLADAGVLAMEPEDVIHPARLVELGLTRPWTRSRTARARQLVQQLPDMTATSALPLLSDDAVVALLQHTRDAVEAAARAGRAPRARVFRGAWVDYFRHGPYTAAQPLSLTRDAQFARDMGAVDVQAQTPPLYVWRVALDGGEAALVTDDEIILPAGTVLAAAGGGGGVVRVRVVDGA